MGPLIATILFDPPHGIQSQGGSLTCTLTCLCTVNQWAMSGATPAFSNNRGVHCITMYTAGLPSRHGGAAVRFDRGISRLRSTSERTIHSATTAGF